MRRKKSSLPLDIEAAVGAAVHRRAPLELRFVCPICRQSVDTTNLAHMLHHDEQPHEALQSRIA